MSVWGEKRKKKEEKKQGKKRGRKITLTIDFPKSNDRCNKKRIIITFAVIPLVFTFPFKLPYYYIFFAWVSLILFPADDFHFKRNGGGKRKEKKKF